MSNLASKGRTIDYLRISLTDRCDLRCVYCMGVDGIENKIDRDSVLSLEEIAQFARLACAEGIKHIRLTGGEPLVRLGIVGLVGQLSKIPQLEDLSMTSNGQLFSKYAEDLKIAGLSRITFSLDSTDANTYRKLTRGGSLEKVFAAIDQALSLGFSPVKINVLTYQLTENDLLEFIHLMKEKPIHIRFIEYMPIGHMGREVRKNPTPPKSLLSMDQIYDSINRLSLTKGFGELRSLKNEEVPLGHGPATSYTLDGSQGSFGLIGVHSQNFCKDCNRLRLTADGKIRSCLFSDLEIPVGAELRANDEGSLRTSLFQAVSSKPLSYAQQQGTKRAMSAIGG
ncbi:MAG: GTP 3',8-cyclase MoaA [Coriobacteriia bacterium]|nr:GTP 3',8-cyclase MoaA [Coriobacteriia bacterium]